MNQWLNRSSSVVITFVVGVWVGIAIGYTICALAAEQNERRTSKNHDGRERAQQKHIDQLKLMAMSVRPVAKSKR
jgi:hypothetical protein